MLTRSRRALRPLLTLAATSVLALSGCSGGDDTGTPTPAVPSQPARGSTPSGSSGPTPTPTAPGDLAVTDTVVQGLQTPWGLDFLPDGDALVTERDTARVLRIGRDGTVATVGTVPGVDPTGEGGLLGLAVSPDFAHDRYVYLYLTAADDNRVVRTHLGPDGRIGALQVLVDGIPKASFHDGGRLVFGPDGMLYASTGEGGVETRAQDRGSLGGKILRMTPTGDVPDDNPFDGSRVYSYGHRNVEGLAFDPQGRLWASEFGNDSLDELNLIRPGRNYGWPEAEGPSDDDRFTDPVATWSTDDASPSGLAWLGHAAYLGALQGERVWQVPLDGTRAGDPRGFLDGDYGRLRTVVVAPDGALWVTTSNRDGRGDPAAEDDRILRVTVG